MNINSEANYAPNAFGLVILWVTLVFTPLIYILGNLILFYYFQVPFLDNTLLLKFWGISIFIGMLLLIIWSKISVRKVNVQVDSQGLTYQFSKKIKCLSWQDVEQCSCYDDAIILKPRGGKMFFLRVAQDKTTFLNVSKAIKSYLEIHPDIPSYSFLSSDFGRYIRIVFTLVFCCLCPVFFIPFMMLIEKDGLGDFENVWTIAILAGEFLMLAMLIRALWSNKKSK